MSRTLSVRLPEELHAKLDAAATDAERPVGELVREAIAEKLAIAELILAGPAAVRGEAARFVHSYADVLPADLDVARRAQVFAAIAYYARELALKVAAPWMYLASESDEEPARDVR